MVRFDSTFPSGDANDPLREAYRRIHHLEITCRRLSAEVLRLKAAGEDQAADQLERELRDREDDIARDRQLIASDDAATARTPFVGDVGHPVDSPSVDSFDEWPPAVTVPDEVAVAETPVVEPCPTRRRSKHGLRKRAPLIASLVVHAVLICGLGWLGFATLQPTLPQLASGFDEPVPAEVLDEITEVALDPLAIDDPMVAAASLEMPVVEPVTIDVPEPLPWSDLGVEPVPLLSPTLELASLDVGQLTAEIDNGSVEISAAPTNPTRRRTRQGQAAFFGAKASGDRFVFLIDNSGTMKEGRMETACLELLRSVGSMKPDQQFYVVFFSDQAYPMFYPDSTDEFVSATRENKQKLEQWLATVEMCTGGELNDAIDMATELKPSAVYLLSDGDIYESRLRRLLVDADKRKFPIHTVGMTVRNRDDAANLAQIAEVHGGTFTPVGVHPRAIEMSRARPIRYNRERGDVWGSKIGKW